MLEDYSPQREKKIAHDVCSWVSLVASLVKQEEPVYSGQ